MIDRVDSLEVLVVYLFYFWKIFVIRFKCHEYEHACFLALTNDKAIYVNNSLLSPFPLVCDKKDLVNIWAEMRRWKRDDFDKLKGGSNYEVPNIPLFNVIIGFQKINNNQVMQGGCQKCQTLKIICIIVCIISVIISVICFITLKESPMIFEEPLLNKPY